MTAIRKITSEDRDFFIAASKAFYASAAVAHDVPASYHLTTFEELMNSEVYQSGYILEVDGVSVGYALVWRHRLVVGRIIYLARIPRQRLGTFVFRFYRKSRRRKQRSQTAFGSRTRQHSRGKTVL